MVKLLFLGIMALLPAMPAFQNRPITPKDRFLLTITYRSIRDEMCRIPSAHRYNGRL